MKGGEGDSSSGAEEKRERKKEWLVYFYVEQMTGRVGKVKEVISGKIK